MRCVCVCPVCVCGARVPPCAMCTNLRGKGRKEGDEIAPSILLLRELVWLYDLPVAVAAQGIFGGCLPV